MNASSNAHGNPSSQLRPRTRRLISGLDADDEPHPLNHDAIPSLRVASPVSSLLDSRSASPLPQARLSRPGSSHGSEQGGSSLRGNQFLGLDRGFGDVDAGGSRKRVGGKGATASSSLGGLWGTSWTTLQSIASDLLGSDLNADPRTQREGPSKAYGKRQPRHSSSVLPTQWGVAPSSNAPGIGSGTREEHENALRTQKRMDMLMSDDSNRRDVLGKFKRRTSEDYGSYSAPPGDNEDREALVYVHDVQKDETLAGITIKYNVAPAVVRRANRMWPNDTVQARKTLVLPVSACGIKGRPVQNGEAIDLLSSENDALSAGQAEEVPALNADQRNEILGARSRANSAHSIPPSLKRANSVTSSAATNDPQWEHDSWVLLPGSQKPTRIARLPRRVLGYFPTSRRKGKCYSDFNVSPSTSLELARVPYEELLSQPILTPQRESSLTPQRPKIDRRLSNATNGYFPSYLSGPGGVGTLGKNVNSPGPAQDSLNRVFAKHLPDVAPPKNQKTLYQPDVPVYSDDLTPIASGTSTPSVRAGGGVDLANVGGTIETWMRKIASNAQKALEKPQARQMPRMSVGAPGRGAGGVGDLIEMTDEFEIGEDEPDDEPERGRQGSVVQAEPLSTATSYSAGAATNRQKSIRGKSKGD